MLVPRTRPIMMWTFLIALCLAAVPASAQTGSVKGTVVDAKKQPVEGATVRMESMQGGSRKFVVKTNRRGEFVQIGLQPGPYRITAEKDGLTHTIEQRISLDMAEMHFTLAPGGGGEASAEERKKAEARAAAVQGAFSEGVAFAQAGKSDEAIAKFNEVLAEAPKCVECYTNIGAVHVQKKDFAQAEASYKQALGIDPNSTEAYTQLAGLYNRLGKFDLAKQMAAEAAKRGATAGGGGNAEAMLTQAVIAWNANDLEGARQNVDLALKADPNNAEAHFMHGRVLIREGKLGEAATAFETYLKLAPSGPNAKEAQSNFEQLKSFRQQ